MTGSVTTLLTLGGLLLIGLITDELGRRTSLPRVTLLLLFGVAIGPTGLDLLPALGQSWVDVVATMALSMVGFLLGETLTRARLRRHGRQVLWVSAGVVVVTAAVVFGGLLAIGVSLPLALLLAGVATSTAPAATVDVIHESGASGPLTSTIEGVVAIDDLWCVCLFSLLLAAAEVIAGAGEASAALLGGLRELGGAVLLGGLLGLPMALLTGRIRPGEPTTAEALGFVFLCGGAALALEVSYLVAAMVMGAVVANLARHHARPFHAIEGIEWPFLVVFFLLAGASLEPAALPALGTLGIAYVGLRALARVLGGWIGAVLGGIPPPLRWVTGAALMPQAGVALGLALVGAMRFEHLRADLLSVVIGSTVVFELIGPLLTRHALRRAGEIPARRGGSTDPRPGG